MWRAVAPAAGRAEPAWIPGGDVVSGEHPGSRDDDNVTDHQRRARKSPARDFLVGVRRRIARPYDRTVAGVERVEDSSRTKCVNAAIAEGRRSARTGAGIRFPEPGRVAMPP